VEVNVVFYSYFKDLAGCERTTEQVPPGSSLNDLLDRLFVRFPRMDAVRHSMLVAVGVDYQDRGYQLKEGDEVSLFPPVQGG
jgi:molybdopterin synthase catalytic subunit